MTSTEPGTQPCPACGIPGRAVTSTEQGTTFSCRNGHTWTFENDPYGTAFAPSVYVNVPDALWEPSEGMDNPTDRLRVTLVVNGRYPMHFEAWAVTYDDTEMAQHLADGSDEDLDGLHGAVNGDGSFYTTTINGREYVLLATPYCN